MTKILYETLQVIEISEYRAQLYDYLKNRMMAIAPNLTLMVGELVGARLIAHAGQSAWFEVTANLIPANISAILW